MYEDIETREDLRKVKRSRAVYRYGGLGLFALAGALLGLFFARGELPALLLGVVAVVWALVLLNQSSKMRDLAGLIEARMDGAPTAGGGAEYKSSEEAEAPSASGRGEETGDAGGGKGEP